MLKYSSIKRNLRQISATVERNIYFELRFKASFISSFINPFTKFIIFSIIFGTIFSISQDYQIGYWDTENFVLFLMMAFCVQQITPILIKYDQLFMREKFWRTLQALLVAPYNKLNLLIGVVLSELILKIIPMGIILVLALIFFPISFLQLLLVFIVFFLMALTFGSIGILIGAFSISNEGTAKILLFSIRLVLALTCINYPLQIFPEFVQYGMLLNPLYYYVDLFRLTWYFGLDNSTSLLYITPIHIIIVVMFSILAPIIAIYLFNKIYNKYGITGY